MLYRLEKKVYQSFSTFLSASGRSYHSGETSAAFVLVFARAREASWPEKTSNRPISFCSKYMTERIQEGEGRDDREEVDYRDKSRLVGMLYFLSRRRLCL
jgi:hypothetical protein